MQNVEGILGLGSSRLLVDLSCSLLIISLCASGVKKLSSEKPFREKCICPARSPLCSPTCIPLIIPHRGRVSIIPHAATSTFLLLISPASALASCASLTKLNLGAASDIYPFLPDPLVTGQLSTLAQFSVGCLRRIVDQSPFLSKVAAALLVHKTSLPRAPNAHFRRSTLYSKELSQLQSPCYPLCPSGSRLLGTRQAFCLCRSSSHGVPACTPCSLFLELSNNLLFSVSPVTYQLPELKPLLRFPGNPAVIAISNSRPLLDLNFAQPSTLGPPLSKHQI